MELLLCIVLIEIMFLVWSLVTGCAHSKEKCIIRIGELFVAGVLFLTGILKWGTQYYPIVAVFGVQIAVGVIIWHCGKAGEYRRRRQVSKCVGNILLYFAVLIPALVFPPYVEPKVTGSHQVEVAEYTWTDESRKETFSDTGEKRELTVKFWYPKEQNEKYPLVVFSHGAFGVIDSNHSTCMELASNGYVVASIGHTYHAMYLEDTNGKVTMADPDFVNSVYEANEVEDDQLGYEITKEWMKLRTEDENFVVDSILEKIETRESPFAIIDSEKIGLFGHSMGGASSVALGRQRSDIDAVIDLEGSMLGECVGFENGEPILIDQPYPIPLLDVYSEDIYNQAKELPEDSFMNFYVGKRAKSYECVIFKGAGHLNFTDLPIVSPFLAGLLGKGEVDPLTCMENVNEMVLTFFDAYLKDGGVPELKKEYGY